MWVETNYSNNTVLSTNKITVNSYTIPFPNAPIVSAVTENSFLISAFFDGDLEYIYYKVQANGTAAPNNTTMAASTPIYPWESEVTVSGLGPAFAYDVYFMGEFLDGKVTVIYKIDVTTLGTATPTLTVSQSQLTLNPVNKNSDSSPASYTITGFHLTSDVVVSATGQMVVSKDNVTFSPQITFLPSAFNGGCGTNGLCQISDRQFYWCEDCEYKQRVGWSNSSACHRIYLCVRSCERKF